jgi:hypothetical protein
MKRNFVFAAFFLFAAWAASAIPTDINYTEGDATEKLKTGKLLDAQIGDVLNTGDTLKTGDDGQVELNQKGVTIKISHGTVFTLMERAASDGKTTTVISVALGSLKYKFDKVSGSEPEVRTNGAVAGVRGTEFTMFAGADGSTLIAVDSGQVDIQSEGKTVQLAAAQGVEVPLGQPPGDVVPLKSDQIDYSKWNNDKLASMLADPVGSMTSIQSVMDEYIKNTTDYYNQYVAANDQLEQAVQTQKQILRDKGKDEASKYQTEVYFPLTHQVTRLVLNYRFYSLAALSLRRFVAGRMYVTLKARYITNLDGPEWKEFQAKFDGLLSTFEQSIAPRLVDADI